MDDCKISHQDSEVNDEFINTLRDEYESELEDGSGKIKVIWGKVHEYLGINLDYSLKIQFNITTMDYINGILEYLDTAELKASGTKKSEAPLNLYVLHEDCEKLIK